MRIKNFIKKNYKIGIGFILGLLISIIGVYASDTTSSLNVSYNNSKSGLKSNTLQGAIDELNEKAKKISPDKNISIGDRLSIGTESFYVISYDDEYIEMLAKYNLNVGNNWVSSTDYSGLSLVGTNLIQNEYCTGAKSGLKVFAYRGPDDVKEVEAEVTCTDQKGYSDELPSYFNDYKEYIEDKYGILISNIRYLNANDLFKLGCTEGTDAIGNKKVDSCSKTGYPWLYSTNYFLEDKLYYYESGTARTSMSISGTVGFRLQSCGNGYRPVIKVSRKYL